MASCGGGTLKESANRKGKGLMGGYGGFGQEVNSARAITAQGEEREFNGADQENN